MLISDHGDQRGFQSLSALLESDKATVTTEQLLDLPNGIMLHYHGNVGSEYAFKSELERLVVLHHDQGWSSIVSVVSGCSIVVHPAVMRQLTL